MNVLKILLLSILVYTSIGIPPIYANSITPAINRVSLSQGERVYGSVVFTNTQQKDTQISLKPYIYNPKTDEILQEGKEIFLKVDTDTINVKANSSLEIKYEIYPKESLELGTYFNILAITPTVEGQDVEINPSISQLVILDILDAQNQVKGITTTQYTSKVEILKKGIPFIKPTILRFTLINNSNYTISPKGRLDIFNEKNSYPPIYKYINEKETKVYPGDTYIQEFKISKWNIVDIYTNRYVKGEVYNGIDSNAQAIKADLDSYITESFLLLSGILVVVIIVKALPKKDIGKKLKKS